MKHLDLFSGIGGFALAAKWAGWDTVGFSEVEPFCCKLLQKRFPNIKNYGDIRKISKQDCPQVDIITGGYPCQPFSVAGQRKGAADDRHLWPAMFRLVQELNPTWVIGENVAGHVSMGLDQVISDLEAEGYTTRAFIIPAAAVDAPHRRDRVWVVANRQGKQGNVCNTSPSEQEQGEPGRSSCENIVANSNLRSEGESRHEQHKARPEVCDTEEQRPETWNRLRDGCESWRPEAWPAEPSVGRVVNGLPRRLDRLRGLGNAIVPQVAYKIFQGINETENKY